MDHHAVMMLRASCGSSPEMWRTVMERVRTLAAEAGASEQTILRIRVGVEQLLETGSASQVTGPCELELWRAPTRLEVHIRWPHASLGAGDNPLVTDHILGLADEVDVKGHAELVAALVYGL